MTSAATVVTSSVAKCGLEVMDQRVRSLAKAITAGDSALALDQFDPTSFIWDVYRLEAEGGELRSDREVVAFVSALHRGGVSWAIGVVEAPSLLDEREGSVSAVEVGITDKGGKRSAVMKVVLSCATGRIIRAAGPLS